MRRLSFLYFFLLVVVPLRQTMASDNLVLHQVTEDVYAIVGELGNRTPENLGNNASFGFIVTTEGVVLIDPGGTYNGAKAIDAIIKSVTDKPVVTVINTGGQDHRWLGNGYFRQQGAEVITSSVAVEDQKARTTDQFFALANLVGDQEVKLTDAVYADKTFQNELNFVLGDIEIEIRHQGQAHTPGDSFVWLPQKSVMFTGDIVYTERMLGIIEYSNSKSWIDVFQAMASLNPKYIVPGHGRPTDLKRARRDTYDYLVFLRQVVTEFMDGGGEISEINRIDQSNFGYLHNYELLAGRNAQQVYAEIEWE